LPECTTGPLGLNRRRRFAGFGGRRRSQQIGSVGIASECRECGALDLDAVCSGIARQLTEAYGWQQAPRYIIRDRIAPMAMSFCAVSERWAHGSGRSHHDHLGRTDVRRMHRSPAPSRPSVARWPCQLWAGCTTNIYECEFPTGTGRSSWPGDSFTESAPCGFSSAASQAVPAWN
jgi:hypothetical protein